MPERIVKYGRKKYTKREDKLIRTLHSFGYSNERISRELIYISKVDEDIHPRTARAINLKLNKMGLKCNKNRTRNWTNQDTKLLKKLVKEGYDIDKMCHELGFSDTTIREKLKNMKKPKIMDLGKNKKTVQLQGTAKIYTTTPSSTEFENKIREQFMSSGIVEKSHPTPQDNPIFNPTESNITRNFEYPNPKPSILQRFKNKIIEVLGL